MRSLKSPWEVLKKWVSIICMNPVRVRTVFYHARFANMSEKSFWVCRSLLHFDLWLETRAKQGRSFFIHTPLRMTGIQTLQFLLVPIKKWNCSLSALLKNFRKGQNFIGFFDRKIQTALFENPSSSGGGVKMEHPGHSKRIKSEQELLINP